MAYELPDLPYDYNALEPYMSARTLEFHHDKHHAKYVSTYNELTKDTDLEEKPIEDVIKLAFQDSSKTGVFNNGAQAWNHTFYWNSLTPNGGGTPNGDLAEKINAAFGGFDNFKEEFKTAAATQFGSGWAWLVNEGGTLKVTKTSNAENPIAYGQTPLLTLDVWEHAYYLDYQNKRPDFIQAFLEQMVNWDFVAKNLAA